jgi:hypothetical protein
VATAVSIPKQGLPQVSPVFFIQGLLPGKGLKWGTFMQAQQKYSCDKTH